LNAILFSRAVLSVSVLIALPSFALAQESLPFLEEFPPTKKIERTAENIKAGQGIYIKRCLPCHGEKGDGTGAAAQYLDPRPRDFTKGVFKIKTTVLDGAPTDEDHFRVVTRGVPGTAMPSWRTLLSEEERWQVIFYEQQTFFPEDRKDPAKRPAPIVIGAEPPSSPEAIKRGEAIYNDGAKAGCFVCHGAAGKGDGVLAPTMRNIWGEPQLPRNFTKSWQFKGGRNPKDIYTRMTTGILASGMPSFATTLTDAERWDVAHFVRSLQKEFTPATKSDIKPKKVSSEIPVNPDDPFWNGVDAIDVLMSGQVTVPPRMQTPAVDMMTVRAVYNDKDVAFHLTWDDRRSNTSHQEPPASPVPGTPGYTTYPVLYPAESRPTGYRDAVAVQMAVKIPNSTELPHFVAGSQDKPVNLWMWKADWNEDATQKSPVEMLISKGHKKLPEATNIQNALGKGVFKDGQWKVVIKRPLVSEDPASVTNIEAGKPVPVAFHAWEGTNGEVGFQRSISAWFFLVIEKEIPKEAYAYTFGMILLAIGFEFFLIRKVKSKA
jgi:mono/diheme cytochrome c family protein